MILYIRLDNAHANGYNPTDVFAILLLEVYRLSALQFYIRHQANFLQDKLILVFKSDEAREYLEKAIPGNRFEKITSDSAEHAVRIGIQGKVIPYGYTLKLKEEEMNQLSTANWSKTAELLAEGNERLYREVKRKAEETKL